MAEPNQDRFDRIDQTLDRVLGLLQDHGRQLDDISRRLTRIETRVDSLEEGSREHLAWHLGRT